MKLSSDSLWKLSQVHEASVLKCRELTHRLYCRQLIYRPDTGEILGVHILGLHAADLIHEASNAIAMGNTIKVRNRIHKPS